MINASIIALLLLIIGLIFLGFILIKIMRYLAFKPNTGKKKKAPGSVSYLVIFIAIVLLIFSWSFFWLGQRLKSFRPFEPPGVIAQVKVWQEHDPVKSLRVEFCSVDSLGLSKPTDFYLSGNAWGFKGQYVILPQFMRHIFRSAHLFKITDFYGDFVGFRPPGEKSLLLAHQPIGGGPVDGLEYVSMVPFVGNVLKVREFECSPQRVSDYSGHEIVLNDSCQISLTGLK